eukprot:1510894-Alexandrium_andersonii.AAC.1
MAQIREPGARGASPFAMLARADPSESTMAARHPLAVSAATACRRRWARHLLRPAGSEGNTATGWSSTVPSRSHSCPTGARTTAGASTSTAARTLGEGS